MINWRGNCKDGTAMEETENFTEKFHIEESAGSSDCFIDVVGNYEEWTALYETENFHENFHIDESAGSSDCFFDAVAQVLVKTKWPEANVTGEDLFQQCSQAMPQLTKRLSLSQAIDVGQIICEKYDVRLHIIQIQYVEDEKAWTHHCVDKDGAIKLKGCNYEDQDMIHITCKGDFHFKAALRSPEIVKVNEEVINSIKSNATQVLKELLNSSPTLLLDHSRLVLQSVDSLIPKLCEQLHIYGPLSSEMHFFLEEVLCFQHLFIIMGYLSKSITTESELLDTVCASLKTFKTYANYFLIEKGLTLHRLNLVFFSMIAEKYERWMEIRLSQPNCVDVSRKTLKEIQLHLTKLLFPLHEYSKLFSTRDKIRHVRLEFMKTSKYPFSCWELYKNSIHEIDEINIMYKTCHFGQKQCDFVTALLSAFTAVNDKVSNTAEDKANISQPYLMMKDVYVLDRILHYINLALSMDFKSKGTSFVDQLVLERALQVTGEYLKNTDETPNLSEERQKTLKSAGVQIQLLTEVRNVLSHYTSKQIFSQEKSSENDVILLENVQKDLKKVRGVILKVVRHVKIKQIQNLLSIDGSYPDDKNKEVFQQIMCILDDIKTAMSNRNIKDAFEKLMSILRNHSALKFGNIETAIQEILFIILPDLIQKRLHEENKKLLSKSEIFQRYDYQKFGIYDHEWADCKSSISDVSSLKLIEEFRKTKTTETDNNLELYGLNLVDIFVQVIMENLLSQRECKAVIQKLKFGFQDDLDTDRLKEKSNSPNACFLKAVSDIMKNELHDQLNYYLDKFLNGSDSNDLLKIMKIQETEEKDFQTLLNKFRIHIGMVAKPSRVFDNILTRVIQKISNTTEQGFTEEICENFKHEVEVKKASHIAKTKLMVLCDGINKVTREEFFKLVNKLQCNIKEKDWEQCYKNRRKCRTTVERGVGDPYDKLINALEKGLDLNGMIQCFTNFTESLQIEPKSVKPIFNRVIASVIEEDFERNFEKQFNDTVEMIRKVGLEIEKYDDKEHENNYLPRWKCNEFLKAALEMAILKVLNIIGIISTPKLCKKLEKLIHASTSHLLGKSPNYTPLRNYLAHGDAMTDMRSANMLDYLKAFADILVQNGNAIMAINKIMTDMKSCFFLQTILSDRNLTCIAEQNSDAYEREIQTVMESNYWKNCYWRKDLMNMLGEEENGIDAGVVENFSLAEFLQIMDRELCTAISYGDLRGIQFFLNHSEENQVGMFGRANLLHLAVENGNLENINTLLKYGLKVNATDEINYTPLHVAVLNQNINAARCLLVSNADANAKDDNGYTALHIAAFLGATDIVLLLQQYGANVREISKFKATPLLLAVWNGHADVAEALLNAGALVDMPNEYLSRLTCLGADGGHDKIVQALLNSGVKVNCHIENAWTPLHQATRKGHLNVVKLLINNGANVNVRDAMSVTPLHIANSASIAEELINAGADVNHMSNSRTPLHVATCDGASQAVEVLLKHGANVEARTTDNWLTTHIAALNGEVNIMRSMVKAGASVNDEAYIKTTHPRKVTPLYLACLYGHLDMVILLLQLNANVDYVSYETVKMPQDLSEEKRKWEWPLQTAIVQQHFEIADALLEHGVNIHMMDENDLTALHYASYYGPLNVVKKLVERGANVNAVTKDDMTPVFYAIMAGLCDIIQILIDHGADLNYKTEEDTVLEFAVRRSQVKPLELLLKNGFNVNSEGKKKSTALHLVCKIKFEDEYESANASIYKMLQLLLDNEANVNAVNIYNDTPLHLAAKNGDADVVKMLLNFGANPNALNMFNITPLQVGIQHGHTICFSLMEAFCSESSNLPNSEHSSISVETSEVDIHCNKNHFKATETWITRLCKEVIMSDNLKNVQELLADKTNSNINLNNYDLLHICVVRSDITIMSELLKHGLDINHFNNDGLTPLHLATQTKNKDLLFFLLTSGADVNSLTKNQRQSALHIAVKNEDVDILEFLLLEDNIIIDPLDLNNETPLNLACQSGQLMLVNSLINHNAQINGLDDGHDSPLHVAVKNNQTEVVVTLLAHGANAQVAGEMQNHPLHYCMGMETMQISQKLIDYGADVNCINADNFTPLHIATQEANNNAIKFLLENGARVDGTREGTDTPLHLTVDKGILETMELFITNNANVNAQNGRKQTPLHLTAIKGDYAMVDCLLQNGASPEIADEDKCTPLFLAVREGHYGIVELLVTNGACVNATCEDGWTILHEAVKTSDVAVVEEVLKFGGNVNSVGKDGWTPLHLAVNNDSLNIVELLIENEVMVNLSDGAHEFPIHIACKSGNQEILERLIEAGAEVNCCNDEGRPPLITAVQYQRDNCIKVLLDNNAAINFISSFGKRSNALQAAIININLTAVTALIENGADIFLDIDGSSFMHIAVCYGSVEILEILHHHGLDVNICGNDDETPLHLAAMAGHANCVRRLLSFGADIDSTTKGDGNSPLLLAIFAGKRDIARILIENGANVNKCDNSKGTPLHLAAERGYADVIQLLLDNGANMKQMNKVGAIALHHAVAYGQMDAVKVLLKHLCSSYPSDPLMTDSGNSTTMKCISEQLNPESQLKINQNIIGDESVTVNKALIDTLTIHSASPLLIAIMSGFDEIAIELIELGANVNLTYDNGKTLLMAAITNNLPNVVRSLIKHGADVNAANNELQRALHFAIEENNLEIVQCLIENKADINVQLEDCGTLLHFSSFHGNAKIVQHFLNFGLDINATSNYGKTPLHAAAHQGCINAVNILLKNGANVNASDNLLRTPIHSVAFGLSEYSFTGTVEENKNKEEEFLSTANSLISFGGNVNQPEENNNTVLHIAAKYGLTNLVRLLLENEATVDGDVSVNCNTPLHLAAAKGHTEIIQLLLEKDANVNQQKDSGLTALYNATYNGHLQAVIALLRYGASTVVKNTSHSLLHTAVCNGNMTIVRLILEYLPIEISLKNYLNAVDNYGHTPLVIAASSGHMNIVELLLLIGAEINILESNKTPLNFAAYEGHIDILKLLLNYGCILDQRDENGDTCLHLACLNGHLDAVKLLLQQERNNLDSITKLSLKESVLTSQLNGFVMSCCGGERHDHETRLQMNPAEKNGCLYRSKVSTPEFFLSNIFNDKHLTPLLVSILEKHEDIAMTLIEGGADVNLADSNGDTPLMFAILKNLPNVVHTLLANGVDTNAVNAESGTALHFAINENNGEVLQYLMENGGNINIRLTNGNTLLHYASSFDHIKIIQLLLQFGLNVNAVNNKGKTCLHVACYKGYANTVAVLIQNGADVNAKDNSFRTPLHIVTVGMFESTLDEHRSGNVQEDNGFLLSARSLILNQADVNATDENSKTVLYYAVDFGQTHIVKLLLDSEVSVNANGNHFIPLHCAAEKQHAEIIRLLVDKGTIVNQVDERGLTALFKAVCKGHVDTAKILLQCGASPNASRAHVSILHEVTFGGSFEIMKLILQNLPNESNVFNAVNAKDQFGNSPLMYACECQHLEIAEFLLIIGANVNAVNENGWSALHRASYDGLSSIVSSILDYGSDVNLKSKNGWTPLYLSARKGHVKVVEVLLKSGANAAEINDHDTILHAATSSKNPLVLKLILDKLKAEPRFEDYLNARDQEGDTPLMWAAEGGHLETVEILLRCGADKAITNKDGMSAMDWAIRKRHSDIIKLLQIIKVTES